MLKNLDNLPNGAKTVKFIQAIGVFLKDVDISKKADKNKLTEMNRKGCAALGGSECAEKRLIGFFTAIVLFSIAKVGCSQSRNKRFWVYPVSGGNYL